MAAINIYDVTYYDDCIRTLVTSTPPIADDWISRIELINGCWLHSLVVGLKVESPPRVGRSFRRNRIATLQLCIGRNCLIFQIFLSPFIPRSLINFLRNPSYTFVGIGIDNDVEKLREDYNLVVTRTTDLRTLAAEAYNSMALRNAGLNVLAIRVLGKEFNIPIDVVLSRWDDDMLSGEQVKYACVDAFVSF